MSTDTATATILVSDLVASTSLRVDLGEERADALRRIVDEVLTDAVTAHAGTVVKGLGDGLLTVFTGAAEAVAAGVAIQQAVESLGRREDVDLAVRVGISAGDVSVEDGDCFGTPVVEASRLCAAAEGGEVLVADVIRLLSRGRGGHGFASRGPLDLKGLPDPVEAWTVPWEPVSSGTGLRQGSPYVGRPAERASMVELLEFARAGRGSTVLVSGEPGIGKTRLVTETCRAGGGVELLWGACHDGDVTAAAAFAEALTTWARATDADVVRAAVGRDGPVLCTLAPALRTVLPDLPDLVEIPADAAAARMQDAVCQWLTRLSSSATVVLVVDDMHWADDVSVWLFRAVGRLARGLRLLVVGTYRETDLDRSHPLAQALPLLRREVEPTRLALDGLTTEEVNDLLRRMAGHDVPIAFASLLADQCDGNPFFIRETLLHLAEEGRIALEDGTWVATTSDLGIPEGVREVLGRRLARLSPAANKLLSVGALFEVAFPLPVAGDVANVAEDDGLDAIDEALAAQIVRPTGEFDTYAFTHALFRHTLVAEMNPSRQVRAHRAIAEAIEKRLRGEPSARDAAILARHFWRSAAMPGAERGVPYALAAAGNAEAGAAFREAHGFFAIARELLEPGDERDLEVQRRLATTAALAGLPPDEQEREAILLGEMLAAADGEDAAADAVSAMSALSAGEEITTTWRLAAVARRWLRPERRDDVWVHLRAAELYEQEATDPSAPMLTPATPEWCELYAAAWSPPRVRQTTWGLYGSPGRPTARRWLEEGNSAATSALLWFASAESFPMLAETCERAVAAALDAGSLTDAVGFSAVRVRALLLLGAQDDADRVLADASLLLPRISERSNAAFQLMACWSFAGWARGDPIDLAGVGLGAERIDDPNTRWAGTILQAAAAEAKAYLSRDPTALDEVAAILPAVENGAGWALNFPLVLHCATSVHWWLERTDHLDVLRRNLDKVLAADVHYPETNARWIAARIASLLGDVEDARRQFDAARDEVRASGGAGLLVPIDFDAALAESRAASRADADRFSAAVAAVRAGAAHPAMHTWIDRVARLRL